MKTRARLAVLAALALAIPAACGDSGVVGGQCREGYLYAEGACLPLRVAAGGSAGSAGLAGSSGADASAGSAGQSGTSGTSGNAGSGGSAGASGNAGTSGSDAGPSDGGPDDASGDQGPPCNVPLDTAQHCGGCDTVCAGTTPFCAPDNSGSYHCVMDCGSLDLCGNDCVDLNVDPDHCGSCNKVCPSGICQGGMCVGANVGHVLLACDDYAQATQTAPQTVLLGNAVFLPLRNPVRILTYTQNTPNAVRTHVTQMINGVATARGRTAPTIVNIANYNNLSTQLDIANFDVFVVEDQSQAATGLLATIGSAWQASGVIDSFARAGGVVVVLAGATGRGEMSDFLSAAQLLPVSAQTVANTTTLYNRAPADGVGLNVISPFVGQRNTCTFTTSASPSGDTVFVIEDAASPAQGNASVVHRVILP